MSCEFKRDKGEYAIMLGTKIKMFCIFILGRNF